MNYSVVGANIQVRSNNIFIIFVSQKKIFLLFFVSERLKPYLKRAPDVIKSKEKPKPPTKGFKSRTSGEKE